MEVIKKQSIESIIVPVRDRLQNLESLAEVSNLRFYVRKKSDDSAVQSDTVPALDDDEPFWCICPIDTTLEAFVPDEEYKLYIKYGIGAESPILGPIFFRVVSD